MMMMKTISISRILTYAILTSSLIIPLAYRRCGWLPATQAILQHIQTYDFGNAVAVVIGVLGYLLEHWFSRKQSQLERQMERVEQQSHQLLVPITMQWHSLWTVSTLSFVDKHIEYVDMPIEQRRIYKQKADALYGINTTTPASESTKQDISKTAFEPPTTANNPISLVLWLEVMYEDSQMKVSYQPSDSKIRGPTTPKNRKKARVTNTHELPVLLHNEINKCDRNSSLWNSYEAFIRHSFVPAVERIASIIDEYGHLMEPVPPARMKELYGTESNGYGQKWEISPRGWFYSFFLSYARSWQELLSVWDAGNKDLMRPMVDFPVGLMYFNIEGQSIVAQVEQQLIGMSQMHGHGK